MQICRHCKGDISKWPIKGQPKKTLMENYHEKTINWKNMFKMDPLHIATILALFLIIFGYKVATEDCYELIENPSKTCHDNGYCDEPKTLETYSESGINFGVIRGITP